MNMQIIYKYEVECVDFIYCCFYGSALAES